MRNNATRCANIVSGQQFDEDLAEGTLPAWSYFTPDINNDGHNTNVTYAGVWLNNFLTPRLALFPPRTLIVISWDEDDYSEENQVHHIVGQALMLDSGLASRPTRRHFPGWDERQSLVQPLLAAGHH